jgi:hypothetical protein
MNLSKSVDPTRLKYFNALRMNKQDIQNKILETIPVQILSPRQENVKEQPSKPNRFLEKSTPIEFVNITQPSTSSSKPLVIQNSHLRKKKDDFDDDSFLPPHLIHQETSFSLAQHEKKKFNRSKSKNV